MSNCGPDQILVHKYFLLPFFRFCKYCKRSRLKFIDVNIFYRFVLGLELDLEQDKAEGYPETICRKCATALSTLSLFKKSVDSGQSKLKSISEDRQKKREEASKDTSENSILPDLDCEVDFGENQPSLGVKAESLEDELEKLESKNVAKENGTKVTKLHLLN